MVYYLVANSRGVERYAETDWDILDMPVPEVARRAQFADPESVNWRSKVSSANPMEQGYRLDPETLPKRVLWANGNRELPDVLPRYAVSPRFRDLVEQFEPGVHQFVPVEIYKDRNGSPVATYYWFIVCQRLDSVDPEHTTYKWTLDRTGKDGFWDNRDVPEAKLVFSNKMVAGHHIWHDPHMLSYKNWLCSDDFAEAAIAADFTGLTVSPRESV